LPAFIALGAGVAVSLLAVNTSVYSGELANLLGGADISIFLGMLVSGVGYYVLARHAVRAEVA
jgi:cytosine/uracil/thiamine/allantoin permease